MSADGTLRAVDLFCGAGGASLGLLESDFSVTGLDTSEHAIATHEHNLAGDAIEHDVSDIRPDLVPADVDLVHASWPCKGHSVAGKMDPDDERNELVWDALDWVEELEPDAVTLENVPQAMDSTFSQALRARFDELGYTVTWDVLDAADYGVPQNRERLIVVATREGSPSLPSPTHSDSGQQTLSGDNLESCVTAGDVLSRTATDGGTVSNTTTPSHTDKIRERFARLEPGQSVSDLPSPGTKKQAQYRLDPAAPSPTVTGGESDLVHPWEDRTLSVREMARIQSFPDWFEFTGPRTSGGKRRQEVNCQTEQVGNAVPPKLMEATATEVRKVIA